MEASEQIQTNGFEDFICVVDDDIDNVGNVDNNNLNKNIIDRKKYIPHSLKPIYENIKMYDQHGKLIGLIPTKKRDWYLKKNLCVMSEDGDSIKITFEPKYKSTKIITEIENCIEKENICVVCGSDINLKKFRVVPYEIKRLFPKDFKSHKSSDVVVACVEDSAYGDMLNRDFKLELYEEYGVDINKFKINSKEKSIYNTLIKIAENNYECSNPYTKQILINFFGKFPTAQEIDEFIEKIKNHKYEGFKTPEEMLVSIIVKNGELDEFVRRWKENFVYNMDPAFLQWDYWSESV